MWVLKVCFVFLYTGFLSCIAILSMLISPRGRYIMPIARSWSRSIFAAAGVRHLVLRRDRIDWSRNYLFLTNHQSQFDILALVLAIPISFRVIAKRILFLIPAFGWVLYLAGFIAIDRTNRERAIRSLDRAAERVRAGLSLLIFAEGTRGTGDTLLPFKKGPIVLGLKAGVPIVPIAVRGGRHVLPKGTLRFQPGTIEVIFGDPIPTRDYTYDTRESLMKRVRGEIQSLLEYKEPAAAPDPRC